MLNHSWQFHFKWGAKRRKLEARLRVLAWKSDGGVRETGVEVVVAKEIMKMRM